MAIIDILTHYDAKKKAAHAAKTVKHGVSTGSLPPPFAPQVPGTVCSVSFCLAVLRSGMMIVWGEGSAQPGKASLGTSSHSGLDSAFHTEFIALCICRPFHV